MICSQKRKFYADRLQLLCRLGLTMPPEYGSIKSRIPKSWSNKTGFLSTSPVIDLQDGRPLYLIWLSLAAQRPGVRVYDYHFEPPWPDHDFQQLPNFANSSIGEAYLLPNKLSYPRGDVLNFRFGKTGWRLPYIRVDGLLCAVSGTPIPEEYGHGAPIRVGVKLSVGPARNSEGPVWFFWRTDGTRAWGKGQPPLRL